MGFKSREFAVSGESLRQGMGGTSTLKPGWYVPKMNGDNEYVAIIRFLPNMLDPAKQIMKKSITWLGDPNLPENKQRKIAVDNPRTIGDWDNPITSLYSDLYHSNDPRKQELARICLGTADKYYAFIQVISDPQQPDKNNQVMMMSFGKKIYDKIVSEADDNNPFDLCDAQMFKLVINKVHGQNDYNKSKFYLPNDITNGYRYTFDNVNWYAATQDTPDAEAIEDQLYQLESAIDITEAHYVPWDAEKRALVEDKVRAVREAAYPELIGAGAGAIYGAPNVPSARPSFIPTISASTAMHQEQTNSVRQNEPVAPSVSRPVTGNLNQVYPTRTPKAPTAPIVAQPQVVQQEVDPAQEGFNTDELFADL